MKNEIKKRPPTIMKCSPILIFIEIEIDDLVSRLVSLSRPSLGQHIKFPALSNP
jgi:hypothetical protein